MSAIIISSDSSAPLPTSAHLASFRVHLSIRLRQLALLAMGMMVLGVIVLATPLGREIDKGISSHFERVNWRREHHQLTWRDSVECQVLYNGIALAGRLVSPEGGAIVWHYLHGQGRDLWLDSNYLQTSQVIQRSLHSLKVGQSRQFSLRQAEDWRLSYALNPFSLRRDEHEVLLWQRMEFSRNDSVRTVLNYGLGKIELPDALIHALHPIPFTVYAKWKI